MKLHGAGSPLSTNGFANALAMLGVDASTLWAVLQVETRGFGFLPSRPGCREGAFCSRAAGDPPECDRAAGPGLFAFALTSGHD
jgi:hypothetical protein